jgi:N-acyl-D-amino-acid deacylase
VRLFLQDGLIVDGSGGTPYRGDVLIDGERIVECGPRINPPSDTIAIDCEKFAISPGFVDIHSHSDLHLLDNGPEKVHQGVTSEVVGNCGFSAFPSCRNRAAVQEYANAILHGNTDWGWASVQEYLEQAERDSRIANVFSLTGHGTLRVAQAGFAQGRLPAVDSDAMVSSLSECLEKGAVGFSTGLMYAPGSSAPPEELTALCKVTGDHGRIHCTHIRSYSWQLLESLEEQIQLAQTAGCRLQISHFQAVGRVNWDKQEAALERMEKARGAGLDIEFDSYPYLAGSTVLTQLLPQAALDGGTGPLLRRLGNASERRDIVRETQSSLAQSWEDVIITSVRSAENQAIVGLSIAAIAEARGVAPAETVVDLVIEESAAINIVSFNQSEPNLRALLTHPLCTVISDGFYVNGRPHPRLFGTFPELLGHYCRDLKWLTLPEAIHKITRKPAERFKLTGRGSLQPGGFADITVFDPETIRSRATYSDPERAPEGIELVLRNGLEVFRRGTEC